MGRNDVDRAMATSVGLDKIEITDEEKRKAVRTVAGSDACRGAGDAKVLLEHLGLYDFALGRQS